MKITKIDNGYTVEYAVENKPDQPSWDHNAYTYHTFAFNNWSDLVSWIETSESLV